MLLDFEVADTAGDGYFEFKEFVAWWTNWRSTAAARHCRIMRTLPLSAYLEPPCIAS
jgi:hypothetical protein